jgi:hypothetical protein
MATITMKEKGLLSTLFVSGKIPNAAPMFSLSANWMKL